MDFPFFDFDKDFLTSEDLLFLAGASGSLIEATATGNPATFATDKTKPLVSLCAPFTPVQAGTGDPSPDNVRAISGFTGITAYRTGKNLLNAVAANIVPFETAGYDNYTLSDGTVHITGQTLFGFKVPVKPGINYHWSFVIDSGVTVEAFDYSAEPNKIRNSDHVCYYQANRSEGTITVPAGSTWIAFAVLTTKTDVTISDIQIEVGSTTSAYEPYSGATFPVAFPSGQTIYGGSLDLVSGVLTVTHKFIDLTNQTGWIKSTSYPGGFYLNVQTFGTKPQTPFICSHAKSVTSVSDYVYGTCFCDSSVNIRIMESGSELTDWATYRTEQSQNGTPVCICAELATPQTIQLDPVTIQTLIGNNTVWTDTNGTNTVVYLKKG